MGAFERTTGKEVWRTALGKWFEEEMGNGPRATPTIDGDSAYMLDSNGGLYRINIKSGKEIWKVSLPDDFKIRRPQRGFSTSPLILGENMSIKKDHIILGMLIILLIIVLLQTIMINGIAG